MIFRGWRPLVSVCALLLSMLLLPVSSFAGPLEDARSMADSGRELLEKAKKAKAASRGAAYATALERYAKAYLLIVNQNLRNDAPDLLTEIGEAIVAANQIPEVAQLRQDLLTQAIDATIAGEMENAWDHLASLRNLDPREWTVEYALGVVGQQMGER